MSNEYIKGRVKCFKIDVFFLGEIAKKEVRRKLGVKEALMDAKGSKV